MIKINPKKKSLGEKIADFFIINDDFSEEIIPGTYSYLLGLNKPFAFALTKSKVKDEAEFKSVCVEVENLLKNDLTRFGEGFYKIPVELQGRLAGTIGSMTIVANNDGELQVRFHKRDSDGYWDDETKRFPEKGTTGKWKHEIFFILEDEEE